MAISLEVAGSKGKTRHCSGFHDGPPTALSLRPDLEVAKDVRMKLIESLGGDDGEAVEVIVLWTGIAEKGRGLDLGFRGNSPSPVPPSPVECPPHARVVDQEGVPEALVVHRGTGALLHAHVHHIDQS